MQEDLTPAFKYKMIALRVLNERMSKVTRATMDDTIGTVTAAAGFEVCSPKATFILRLYSTCIVVSGNIRSISRAY
jgi:hypothetical protein